MHLKKITIDAQKFPTREQYPFNLDIFNHTQSISLDSPVSFFVGENGSGKSTLLKAIARKCGIYIWSGMQTRRFQKSPYEDQLHHAISVEWEKDEVPGSFFASQIFQNFSRALDTWAQADPEIINYFGGKSLMAQSHGESLMSFFKSRFSIKGLYLLDEPETALSPKSLLELLQLLIQVCQSGHAQFIIATHSPILMACPETSIFSFDQTPLGIIEYEKTEHYRIYKDFMQDRNRYINAVVAGTTD
ncbi:MAG: AAA family ATPase [Desulfobacterales bacterium]|nr:AAA family ATPase [Desulfobacterales bacterium]